MLNNFSGAQVVVLSDCEAHKLLCNPHFLICKSICTIKSSIQLKIVGIVTCTTASCLLALTSLTQSTEGLPLPRLLRVLLRLL